MLVGIFGLVYPIGHAVGYPLRSRAKIGQGVIADHSGAPAGESFAGTFAAEVVVHGAFAEFGFKQRADARGVAVRGVHLDGIARGVIAAHVVGAAGAIGLVAQGKNDRADRTASGAEDAIVGGGHTIGVVDQILRILHGLGAERGLNI